MKNSAMNSGREQMKGKRQEHRLFTPAEKCRAVLSVWSERRSPAEVCREISITFMQFRQWQNHALKGILIALDTKKDQVKCPPLSARLEKLLEGNAATPAPKQSKLEKRLEKVQQEKGEEAKTA